MPRSCVQVLTSSQHGADIWFGDPRDPRFRKNNFMQICSSQTEREFIVLCTSFGGCLTVMAEGLADFWSRVLTCARPHDTVTRWPLSFPLGDLSMVLGNYRWDAQREMNCRRVKAKEFDYRALFQCRMATELLVYAYFCMFTFHPAFIAHFKTVTTDLWLSLHPQKPQGSLTASNGQKLMPNLQPSCKFRLFINDHPWLFMIHISDYRAEVRTNTALQSPENPPRLDTLDPAANMRGRSRW